MIYFTRRTVFFDLNHVCVLSIWRDGYLDKINSLYLFFLMKHLIFNIFWNKPKCLFPERYLFFITKKNFPFFFCTRFIYNHLFYTQNFSLTLIAFAFSNWNEMAPYCRKRYHDSWYPPFWYLIDGRPNDSSCKSSWKSSILAIRRVKAIYSIVTGSRT